MKTSDLERLLVASLGDLDLGAGVEAALAPPGATPTRLIAIGKAAPAMAVGAIARLGSSIERAVIVVPDGTSTKELTTAGARAALGDRLQVLRAAHPLPDARSVRAADACLALASGAGDARTLLVLVSGGASALVCAPSAGITLRAKRSLTSALLRSGASIQELNVVRKHLSRIKGGGLLAMATRAERRVQTLVASDVIGGTLADVGSGPSVVDPSSVLDARRLLRRHAPELALRLPLVRSPGSVMPVSPRSTRASLIASPEALALAVATRLRAQGHVVRVLPPSQASVETLAAEYLARARRGPGVLVRAAEPSVRVTKRGGRGGRSTHLAALVGRDLPEHRHVTFVAFASDGVDGTSETGGAMVDASFAMRVRSRLGDTTLAQALTRFDTGSLHRAVGTALPLRPSGHNLADIHVLIVG